MIDEKKLIEERTYYPSPVSDYEAGWNDCNRDWMKRIEEQPQAGYGAGKWMGSVCSCCGESVSEWYNFKFCPMCGAKMDDYEE